MKTRISSEKTGGQRALVVLGALALLASACTSSAGNDDASSSTPDTTLRSDAGSTTEAGGAETTTSVTEQPQTSSDAELLAGMVVAEGGASDVMKRVRFDLGTTTFTSATPESFISGSPVLDEERRWLIVDLSAESVASTMWTLADIELVDAQGQEQAVGQIHDAYGETARNVRFVGRDTRQGFISFEMDDAPEDLASWAIRIGHEEEIPLLLPLDGPGYSRSYPFPLPHGEVNSVWSGNFGGCAGDGIEMGTLIDAAWIDLEQTDGRSSRADAGQRIVHIDLALTNPNDEQLNCEELVLWPDFFLEEDGTRTTEFRYNTGPVERGATLVLNLTFEISATSERLELIGGGDERTLAGWDISLPEAVGEAGLPSSRVAQSEPILALELAPSPSGLSEGAQADGGATGAFHGAQFTIGSSSTSNASFVSIVSGSPIRDEQGRAYVVVGTAIENMEDREWFLQNEEVVLEDPNGRPYAASTVLDEGGDTSSSVHIDEGQTYDVRYVFETLGLVTDLDGWTLVVEPDGLFPLRLPLVGEALDEFPIPLVAGASRSFSVGSFPGCNDTEGDEMNATIDDAALDVERRDSFGTLRRISPEQRYLGIDVALTNLLPPSRASATANCGAVVLWPPFLLRADGRFLQPASFVNLLVLDEGETGTFRVVFAVPEETQSIEFYAGIDPTLIVGWQLLDNGEVLQDFGAEKSAEETLVTLDERVLFAFGSSELADEAVAPLTRLASVLTEDSTGEITITGHTDSIGDDASNDQLSRERAEAVVAFLVEAGVDPNRMTAIGAGETSPIATNENEDGTDNPIGRAMNRRVEVLFTTS